MGALAPWRFWSLGVRFGCSVALARHGGARPGARRVGYLLFSPEIASVAAAATSVRGSDYTIAKSSKIKTNESPSSSVQSFEQRRVLSGYVMTNSNI